MIYDDAKRAGMARECVLAQRPYGTLLRGDPAFVEAISALIARAQRDAIEECLEIIRATPLGRDRAEQAAARIRALIPKDTP